MEKNNSPYTAITGCTFLYYEFGRILPLLMDANSESLLKNEIENNRVLQINSIASRKRCGGVQTPLCFCSHSILANLAMYE